MAFINTLILRCLDDLHQDELKRFKLYLTSTMAQGFDPIARSKLENANQHDVLDLMKDHYGQKQAAEITVQVLKQIGKKEPANNLEKELKGQTQAAEVDGVSSSSSSSSSPAAGVSQSISAERTSTVHAPLLSGGTYNGPVNINCTNSQK